MSVKIPLTQGLFAQVDAEDAEKVLRFKWWASRSVSKRKGDGAWYARGRAGSKNSETLMHVFIMGKREGFHIDHIDGDTLNNCKSNLRHCTQSQNLRNRITLYKRNTSGVNGVIWDASRNKWQVRIHVNGRQKLIGRFESKEDAAAARRAAELEYYGEYAPQTIPRKRTAGVMNG